MGKLEGKVAIVTGSGRNIGRATVLKLAAEGAHVVVNARTNQAEADAVVREAQSLGVKALAVIADIARTDQVEALAARAMSEFGRIDILINNAAIRPHKPFTELTMEDWEAVRGVVLDGPLVLTRAVIESMVEHRYGRILFFTGEGAFIGGSGRAHVSAAKMGLVGFARGLASEFAAHNIRVNVVSPGSIDTQRANPEWYQGRTPSATGIPSGARGRWRRSPPPVCSWSVTMAASSPARLSTSTAGAPITEFRPGYASAPAPAWPDQSVLHNNWPISPPLAPTLLPTIRLIGQSPKAVGIMGSCIILPAREIAGARRMKFVVILCTVAAMLAGCVADQMRSYMGQDIRTVELAYGPPSNQIDLGDGTRAFQWTKISVDTTPASAVTTTDKDKKGRKITETQFVGGNQTVTRCLYTFITTWRPAGNTWIVTGIREPSFDCAIGGLS